MLDDSTGANAQLSSVYDWLNKLDGKTVTAELLLSVGGMGVSVEGGGGSIVPTIDDRLIIPETDDRTGAMPPMPVQREYPTAHEIAIAMRDAMMAVT